MRLISTLFLAASAALCAEAPWQPLFDGKSLEGWKETPFSGPGKVRVESGAVVLGHGEPMTGITRTAPFPAGDYEIRFEAARFRGSDFFASLTFPAGGSCGTWVTGGWGGDIVGLSSIDDWDASTNETRSYFNFEPERWYAFRLRVAGDRISAWIDETQVFNVALGGRTLSLRPGEIEKSAPLGFASYKTEGRIRKIEWRPIAAKR